jgi:hypothetical protein
MCVGHVAHVREMKNFFIIVRFQVLTAASMMFRAVFWVVLHGSTTQKTALNIILHNFHQKT